MIERDSEGKIKVRPMRSRARRNADPIEPGPEVAQTPVTPDVDRPRLTGTTENIRPPEPLNEIVAATPGKRRPIDERFRCTAHSTRTGLRCRRAAIRGGNVCPKHGGAAIQVKRKAKKRLEMSADRAITVIKEIMEDESVPATVRLKAARDIADRNGLAAPDKVELELTGFQKSIARAVKIRRPGAARDEPTTAGDAPEIVDAEVVEDEPATEDVARPSPRDTLRSRAPAMFSQGDLQDGVTAPHPTIRRPRDRSTKWER